MPKYNPVYYTSWVPNTPIDLDQFKGEFDHIYASINNTDADLFNRTTADYIMAIVRANNTGINADTLQGQDVNSIRTAINAVLLNGQNNQQIVNDALNAANNSTVTYVTGQLQTTRSQVSQEIQNAVGSALAAQAGSLDLPSLTGKLGMTQIEVNAAGNIVRSLGRRASVLTAGHLFGSPLGITHNANIANYIVQVTGVGGTKVIPSVQNLNTNGFEVTFLNPASGTDNSSYACFITMFELN